MEPVVAHPPVVVAVDHLAHQQAGAVGPGVVAHAAELPPEVRVDLVRHVEAPAVDANLLDPEPRDVEDVVLNRGLVQVQPGQHRVALPAVVGEPGSLDGVGGAPPLVVPLPRADVIPVAELRRVRALLPQILKREMLLPGVVKDAVQDNLDADVVQLLDDLLEELHVAEAAIDLEVIERVVPVRAGLEEGRKIDSVDAELSKVLVVLTNLLQPRVDGKLLIVHGGCAEVPEGEDLVEHRLPGPLGKFGHVRSLLPVFRSLDLLKRLDGGWDSLDGGMAVAPAVPLRFVVNLDGGVLRSGGDHAVGAALPPGFAVGSPPRSHHVLVLDELMRGERHGDLPLVTLDPVHRDSVDRGPVAQQRVAAGQAEVIAEVGLDLDVERALVGRDGRRRRRDVGLVLLVLLLLLELHLGAVGLDVLARLLLLSLGFGLAGDRGDGRELVALLVVVIREESLLLELLLLGSLLGGNLGEDARLDIRHHVLVVTEGVRLGISLGDAGLRLGVGANHERAEGPGPGPEGHLVRGRTRGAT